MKDVASSKPRVVITHWVHDDVIDHLHQFATAVPVTSRTVLSRDEVLARARDADGLLACMTDRVDDDFLDRCPRLRVVSATLKGYDNFDVAACARHGVWLTALPHQLTAPTAELGIGLIIGLMRHVAAGDRHVRSGTFRGWRPELYGAGLAGATVGMIGMGAIGQALARRLRAFDAGVLYHDIQPLTPEREAELDVRQASLDELLAASHVVLPLLPLRDDTAGLLDRNALAQMRTGAYLVNVSRGSLVDEAAVADALESGRLGGYAADVFAVEDWALGRPPRSHRPHLARAPAHALHPPSGLGGRRRPARDEPRSRRPDRPGPRRRAP